jgi:hypothetical protein
MHASAFSRAPLALLFASVFATAALAGEAPNASTGKPAGGGKAAMRQRCLAAVAASGHPAAPKPTSENAYDAGPGNYLFEFKQPDGGSFFCQVCDDLDDDATCPSLGLELSHRPAQGEQEKLPAELDRKCVYYLQKELGPRGSLTINRSLVERIKVTPSHTEQRFVYLMNLSMDEYRCVIRKSDGNFLVEKHNGADWKPIAAGVMF